MSSTIIGLVFVRAAKYNVILPPRRLPHVVYIGRIHTHTHVCATAHINRKIRRSLAHLCNYSSVWCVYWKKRNGQVGKFTEKPPLNRQRSPSVDYVPLIPLPTTNCDQLLDVSTNFLPYEFNIILYYLSALQPAGSLNLCAPVFHRFTASSFAISILLRIGFWQKQMGNPMHHCVRVTPFFSFV